jgi:ubiquinone/menaquinone biosynthesis C-methylase UbiE
MTSVLGGGVQWGVDRMLSVGYGLVYDYIFERFPPYQELQAEVLKLVESAVPDGDRRAVQVLDIGCGPGNFTLILAEAGFTAVGVDAYDALVELAKEKRRSKRLANVAFRQGTLDAGFRAGSFDQVVSIHSLYVHPQPDQLLRDVYRILKPGGHVVLVNHTRRMGRWSTFQEIRCAQGLPSALRSLVWVLPNSIFETTRRRIGPHYWSEEQFGAHLREAGFTVLETRRTFLNGASLLVWARKDAEG